MGNIIEKTKIEAFRVKDRDDKHLGVELRCNFEPYHFYIVERNREFVSTYFYGLLWPTAVFTLKKSANQLLSEFLLAKKGFENIRELEKRPMWIDDSEIHNVGVLCDKCRQMKQEYHIQVVMIDEFQHLVEYPDAEKHKVEKRNKICKQLCQLANELGVVMVAFENNA